MTTPLARPKKTAFSLAARVFAMIAVVTAMTAFAGEARADGESAKPKQGAATAQVLAEESKPGAQAKPHATANANAKAQAHPKAKAKAKAKTGKSKPHAKPAKAPAPAKPAKPGATARA